jgi:hypothetical protein
MVAAGLSFVSTIALAVLAAHLLARLALEAALQHVHVLASVPQIVRVLVPESVRQPVSVSVLALRDSLVKPSQGLQQPRVMLAWLEKPGALGRWQTSLLRL